ncbi:hypothetical protein NC661_06400 [Aquibacillus koreensis]|uniref:Uncharacterized protein n=1 Tax=Aquibacillus koreensis TaxID=279446 RepID=A0A9X3WME9_9BACI|nr:hypothetical protein [Aquibacillus koreensis]MCT2535716.1 hypothetical protein [Aquibacillus koreensis]MDC3419999.1 hypothetical protein [Aquibacillus koreensis]
MNQEVKVVEELQKMMTTNEVPVSVQEDINELCQKFSQGTASLNELQHGDPFIEEVVQKAIKRIEP